MLTILRLSSHTKRHSVFKNENRCCHRIIFKEIFSLNKCYKKLAQTLSYASFHTKIHLVQKSGLDCEGLEEMGIKTSFETLPMVPISLL